MSDHLECLELPAALAMAYPHGNCTNRRLKLIEKSFFFVFFHVFAFFLSSLASVLFITLY